MTTLTPMRCLLLAAGLLSASGCHVYRSDVGKLCDAEQLAQSSLKANRTQLLAWMARHVASADGIHLVQDLDSRDARGIGIRLREEARRAGLTSCALADNAELLAKDDDFHADMVNLCAGSAPTPGGSVARLDVADADDAERLREITAWTATNAKSPDTVAIVAKLGALGPRQRGALLRGESGKVGVASCLLASTLDTAPPTLSATPASQINPSFTVVNIDAPQNEKAVIAGALVATTTAAAINACYAVALATVPTLTGTVSAQLTFDASGHASQVGETSSTIRGAIIPCVMTALRTTVLGGSHSDGGKKGARVTVTLLLTPSTSGPGFGATIEPAALGASTKTPHGRHH